MKQLLDTFGRWGGFVLHTVLLLVATFLIGFEVKCPWYYWAAWKGSGVFCLFLWDFIGKQALFAENFPCF
jgi:hypothetical protein